MVPSAETWANNPQNQDPNQAGSNGYQQPSQYLNHQNGNYPGNYPPRNYQPINWSKWFSIFSGTAIGLVILLFGVLLGSTYEKTNQLTRIIINLERQND